MVSISVCLFTFLLVWCQQCNTVVEANEDPFTFLPPNDPNLACPDTFFLFPRFVNGCYEICPDSNILRVETFESFQVVGRRSIRNADLSVITVNTAIREPTFDGLVSNNSLFFQYNETTCSTPARIFNSSQVPFSYEYLGSPNINCTNLANTEPRVGVGSGGAVNNNNCQPLLLVVVAATSPYDTVFPTFDPNVRMKIVFTRATNVRWIQVLNHHNNTAWGFQANATYGLRVVYLNVSANPLAYVERFIPVPVNAGPNQLRNISVGQAHVVHITLELTPAIALARVAYFASTCTLTNPYFDDLNSSLSSPSTSFQLLPTGVFDDSDGDDVHDLCDRCPDTPPSTVPRVDLDGCPRSCYQAQPVGAIKPSGCGDACRHDCVCNDIIAPGAALCCSSRWSSDCVTYARSSTCNQSCVTSAPSPAPTPLNLFTVPPLVTVTPAPTPPTPAPTPAPTPTAAPDADADGVPDIQDLCPNTPLSQFPRVNASGCPASCFQSVPLGTNNGAGCGNRCLQDCVCLSGEDSTEQCCTSRWSSICVSYLNILLCSQSCLLTVPPSPAPTITVTFPPIQTGTRAPTPAPTPTSRTPSPTPTSVVTPTTSPPPSTPFNSTTSNTTTAEPIELDTGGVDDGLEATPARPTLGKFLRGLDKVEFASLPSVIVVVLFVILFVILMLTFVYNYRNRNTFRPQVAGVYL